MTLEGATVVLYRVVWTNPPTVEDMKSHEELGIPLRNDNQETIRLSKGISLFDSVEQARKQARGKPWLGNAFLAELAVPIGQFRFEQTGKRKSHYTLWGKPHDILRYVIRIERV